MCEDENYILSIVLPEVIEDPVGVCDVYAEMAIQFIYSIVGSVYLKEECNTCVLLEGKYRADHRDRVALPRFIFV